MNPGRSDKGKGNNMLKSARNIKEVFQDFSYANKEESRPKPSLKSERESSSKSDPKSCSKSKNREDNKNESFGKKFSSQLSNPDTSFGD